MRKVAAYIAVLRISPDTLLPKTLLGDGGRMMRRTQLFVSSTAMMNTEVFIQLRLIYANAPFSDEVLTPIMIFTTRGDRRSMTIRSWTRHVIPILQKAAGTKANYQSHRGRVTITIPNMDAVAPAGMMFVIAVRIHRTVRATQPIRTATLGPAWYATTVSRCTE
eukprot:Rmarinus@m.23429